MPYQPDVFMAGFYVISRLTWEQGSSVYLTLPILLIFKRHLNALMCYEVSFFIYIFSKCPTWSFQIFGGDITSFQLNRFTNKKQRGLNIMKKNKKFQKDQLAADGYTEFVEFFNRD